jgi:alkyl hydroperoxide reductase subunit AhpC
MTTITHETPTTQIFQTARVGKPAPDFAAPVYDPDAPNASRTARLADYAGQWLLLFWYPLDFTTVCPTEINALADRKQDFDDLGCAILGASTDSVPSHKAWAAVPREDNGIAGLNYPLLADRTQTIARAYGVLVEDEGIALRGLFLIDSEGVLQYTAIHNMNIGRNVTETLRVLEALQTGGLCPSDWKPGQKTLTRS